MKTLNILVLALLLFVAPYTAKANDGTTSYTDSIASKIQNTVHLPAALSTEENQRVFVVFSIAENGDVLVHEVGSADVKVKASITDQFQAMHFDNTNGSYDGMYSIWLNFKTL